ncbi:hypothetical protein, conserved [Trypanosoma brucei gambiense DAL972]|uniref:Uncharacterized protein n=1 Tax=Trypanosoma brucei gambiense (strain MHOM/CI/86/DAL972) TaxID=679716 RepID=C9ZHU5_TRYB9|nr:hypothetical protein, conserved [Trypanosoma brucei gambiense DAL972]CBH08816.1 hypothetical protein, conserved [Trypanosoma brucei gambiense DAL972]|eukprot:XP_011771257.1 hypothetical protein, conserved [Trypanosoma brucei gambiense DAL972]
MDEIKWPLRLLQILRNHLEQVDHPHEPRTLPIAAKCGQGGVLAFLTDVDDDVRRRTGASECITACCRGLVLDMIEQCCTLLFLSSKERRVINMAAVQREKRVVARGVGKRRRGDQGETTEETAIGETDNSQRKCAAVLPLEYLLRLFVALPSLLAHYDKLGGFYDAGCV